MNIRHYLQWYYTIYLLEYQYIKIFSDWKYVRCIEDHSTWYLLWNLSEEYIRALSHEHVINTSINLHVLPVKQRIPKNAFTPLRIQSTDHCTDNKTAFLMSCLYTKLYSVYPTNLFDEDLIYLTNDTNISFDLPPSGICLLHYCKGVPTLCKTLTLILSPVQENLQICKRLRISKLFTNSSTLKFTNS